MNAASIIDLFFHGAQLKRTPRTGWTLRGVVDPESVAAHSFGVGFVSLILAQTIDSSFDLGKLLAMAALHDLPEGLTTDIPAPASRLMPPGSKLQMERKAMAVILDEVSFGPDWMTLWEELHARETAESRLVQDADKLEMYVQAIAYEESSGNRRLSEFWKGSPHFHFPEARTLYEALRSRRENLSA